MIVIGGGSSGLVTAYICGAAKARVALIEKHKMGGDCLNTGCVPSKALIRSAKFMKDARHAQSLGFKNVKVDYDFSDIMERIQRVIKTIEPHDSVERYQSLGVDCYQGEARILSPHEISVGEKRLTTKNITLATGASPFIPPVPGMDPTQVLTSDTIWSIRKKPEHLVVLGGGPVGSELAQAFVRFGIKVTQVEMGDRILRREDPEISQMVLDHFKKEGIEVLLNHRLERISLKGNYKVLECDHQGHKIKIKCDSVLAATGRKANSSGLGLEELGVELNPNGTVKVDSYLRTTKYKNIYACGDVTGPFQFTHTASHQAWYCSINSMLKPFWGYKVDYRVIPRATYTDPEIARVGLNEQEACERNIPHEVTTYAVSDLDRAIADEEAYGLVKVLTVPGKDKILGTTIAGIHAGDRIVEFVSAMKQGFGMNRILGTIHIYPTLSEANKSVAGQWRRNHISDKALAWARLFNNWQRRRYF